MALDMDMLRNMFYEECRENLDVLENILVNLDSQAIDKETIDTIFRAAHSIKGGAATFSLTDISEFTHAVEAYLDKVRNDELSLTKHSIDTLLRSCDHIHHLLECHESGSSNEQGAAIDLHHQLDALLVASGKEDAPLVAEPTSSEPNDAATGTLDSSAWVVCFEPHPSIFYSGNDPLRILRELKELDAYAQIACDDSQLPELAEIDPELCYTHWQITLSSLLDESAIREVFDWVEDECDLSVTRVSSDSQQGVTQPNYGHLISSTPSHHQDASEMHPSAGESTSVNGQPSLPEPLPTPPPVIKQNAKQDAALTSIRVDIDKVDNLINLVGELVITQSMLNEIGNDFTMDKLEKLKAGLEQLLQNSKDLQENVLNIRMLPMSFAFSRFPRLVRDLSSRLGKNVELEILGEQTELDKTVLERIVDPLVHLVRNGIDHGIEDPEARLSKGKPENGRLLLNAFHQGGSIVIEVKDDGHGLDCDRLWQKAREKKVIDADVRREEMSDKQIMNLIFAPGFSTAESVSDISGRGVGMDVVRRNIEELGGHIDVDSALGVGSTFTISLPLTLAILDGQLIKVAGEVYVIPLLTIIESIQIDASNIIHASGGVELYRLREENIPIVRLQNEFDLGEQDSSMGKILCFVEAASTRVGILLDELLDQQQVVIKSLESNYSKVPGISGATILGDGSVSLILDIQGLITHFLQRTGARTSTGSAGLAA